MKLLISLFISISFIVFIILYWQYSLNARLVTQPISCGGDWSYSVKCPLGSTCLTGSNALRGGECQAFLSNLFRLAQIHSIPNPKYYSCPSEPYIECFKPRGSRSPYCDYLNSQDFLLWAKQACPEFKGFTQ